MMPRKTRNPPFDETLNLLRAHSFDVTPHAGHKGSFLVAKDGAAAVLVAGPKDQPAFLLHPGVLLGGQVARLTDRGYQKFLTTDRFELPATAAHLHAIHAFSQELALLLGSFSLYNQSLGTTSDLYLYDRIKGREALQPVPARPWELAGETH
jgi:hypothetical protein